MNIISDIAGQYDALLSLIDKMPKDEILFLGDLIDRGPKSKEVVQYAIDNNIKTLLGNHEHMMIDYFEDNLIYSKHIWVINGGDKTLESYGSDSSLIKEHVEWLKKCILYYETDNVFISHAAWIGSLEQALNISNLSNSIIWSREEPIKRKKFQIMGHNSHWGLRWFCDDVSSWAVCLDQTASNKITGMHWPSKKIYQVNYNKKD
ncbi:MAG: metallophosphoesterase [Nanoarchaeota archaeon]|nr:metallophosphoesterase [Nanoarchaeota archaeon]